MLIKSKLRTLLSIIFLIVLSLEIPKLVIWICNLIIWEITYKRIPAMFEIIISNLLFFLTLIVSLKIMQRKIKIDSIPKIEKLFFLFAGATLITAISIVVNIAVVGIASVSFEAYTIFDVLYFLCFTVLLSLSTALFEEFLFRYLLWDALSVLIGKILSTFILSLVFAFLHIAHISLSEIGKSEIMMVLLTFIVSLFLFKLRIEFNIWACVILHFIWNCFYCGQILMISDTEVNYAAVNIVTVKNGLSTGYGNIESSLSNILLFTILLCVIFIYKKVFKNRNIQTLK